jgi:cytochrome P450
MILSPSSQLKAQAEIDAVIGRERLPRLSDRERLPYVNALVLEVIRWAATVPAGIPHAVTEDDIHAGYFVPKGTIIIPNIRYVNHPTLQDPSSWY